ncbi:MAG: heme exporter protein CcmB [Acidobacteria bacterium]|nr:heme exporter protein CcmB [Acidobacteriota bacterium]
MLGKIAAVFLKDLRLEWRSRETLVTVCLFSIVIIFIFNFGFDPTREESLRLLPGLLWVAFAFSGVWGCNRSFATEKENGCLEAIMLAPMDPGIIYLGKVLANLLFILVAEMVVLFLAVIWYNLPFKSINGWLLLVVFLGTFGYVAVGTLFAAIAVNTRMREVMLPILHFPVAVPVFIAAMESTAGALRAQPVAEYVDWIRLLFSFSIIFTTASYLLFRYVMEE